MKGDIMLDFILQYWLEILFGVLISLFTYLYKKYNGVKKISKTVEERVVALLKNEILNNYCILSNKSSVTMTEKETINTFYDQYVVLTNKEDLRDLLNKINNMPIEECVINECIGYR
jgi:hypothetical protein